MNFPSFILILTASSFLVFELVASETRRHKIREMECNCGIGNHDEVVVSPRGNFPENHAWPWMASIVNMTNSEDPEAYCGGSLINDRYILTAAHCIPDMMDTGIHKFRVYLGTNYIDNGKSSFLNLKIRKILSHPQFDFDSADNDISLIKLSEPVTFNDHIRPICLTQSYDGDSGYIAGWGSYNLSEPTETSLKEDKAVIVSNEICAKNYSSVDIPITENMICASIDGNGRDGVDPCKGDSGGPMFLPVSGRNDNTFTQIGIISHGEGCSVSGFPSIFSRVSAYINWIQENTKDGIYCSDTFSS